VSCSCYHPCGVVPGWPLPYGGFHGAFTKSSRDGFVLLPVNVRFGFISRQAGRRESFRPLSFNLRAFRFLMFRPRREMAPRWPRRPYPPFCFDGRPQKMYQAGRAKRFRYAQRFFRVRFVFQNRADVEWSNSLEEEEKNMRPPSCPSIVIDRSSSCLVSLSLIRRSCIVHGSGGIMFPHKMATSGKTCVVDGACLIYVVSFTAVAVLAQVLSAPPPPRPPSRGGGLHPLDLTICCSWHF